VTGEVRVLLADDQALVRAGFRALLDAEPGIEVVGEAADGEQAVRLATELLPDVVLMDVRMPVLDGLEATRLIGADPRPAGVHVVVLTTFEVDEYVFEALRAGASGFLVNDTEPVELLQAVRVVAAGDALLSPGVTRRLIEEYAAHAKPGRSLAERPCSPTASARWSRLLPAGCPTTRSRGGCSSAQPRPRPMSAGRWASSPCATGRSWWCLPTTRGWCGPAGWPESAGCLWVGGPVDHVPSKQEHA